jgi:putative flippase GtrA
MNLREALLHRRMRMLRFLIVGGSGFALYLLLASSLRAITTISPAWAAALATLLAVLPTFQLQRVFTFQSSGPYARELLSYALLQLVNAGVIAFAAKIGAQSLRLPDLPDFVIAGMIGVVFSYLVQRWLIFRHAHPNEQR